MHEIFVQHIDMASMWFVVDGIWFVKIKFVAYMTTIVYKKFCAAINEAISQLWQYWINVICKPTDVVIDN